LIINDLSDKSFILIVGLYHRCGHFLERTLLRLSSKSLELGVSPKKVAETMIKDTLFLQFTDSQLASKSLELDVTPTSKDLDAKRSSRNDDLELIFFTVH
jgi:hypothetical protein